MYGINNKTAFLMARDNENYQGMELCVQTEWPHIVGKVRKFGPTETQEQERQEWTARKGEGVMVVQHHTHRVYVELVGSMQDVRRDKIEQSKGMPVEQYVRQTLERMAQYVVDNMNEKQQYAYSWEHRIVPDDYYKLRRAIRKAWMGEEQP